METIGNHRIEEIINYPEPSEWCVYRFGDDSNDKAIFSGANANRNANQFAALRLILDLEGTK